jgi:hypothetical protein
MRGRAAFEALEQANPDLWEMHEGISFRNSAVFGCNHKQHIEADVSSLQERITIDVAEYASDLKYRHHYLRMDVLPRKPVFKGSFVLFEYIASELAFGKCFEFSPEWTMLAQLVSSLFERLVDLRSASSANDNVELSSKPLQPLKDPRVLKKVSRDFHKCILPHVGHANLHSLRQTKTISARPAEMFVRYLVTHTNN